MKYYGILLLLFYTIDLEARTKNPRDPIFPSPKRISKTQAIARVETDKLKLTNRVEKKSFKRIKTSTHDHHNYKKQSETFAVLAIMLGVLCIICGIAVIRTHTRFQSQLNS